MLYIPGAEGALFTDGAGGKEKKKKRKQAKRKKKMEGVSFALTS